MPESVEYDPTRDRFYVSNINDGVMKQDDNGSIGLLDAHGKLLNVDWISGLHSPKGLALYNNKLYVADVKQLVVINVDSGKLIARYAADESMVLNGITISKAGTVFVSDWMGNRIYTLDDGELKIWLEDSKLNSPNGLWVDDSNLYVASWGAKPKADFTTETSGNIKQISLNTKIIKTLPQNKHWINMDGISRYSKNRWIVTDFIKGEVLLLDTKGRVKKLLAVKKGSADFYYIREKNLLVIPLMMDNQVVAYTPEHISE
ncbi:MAG TPA: GTP-binding protein [Gammaproteobacteria bacterium]|nr:GTP-binding protein [Gammaproteobacteria bacterium]